jgi:hypothetical protein
MSFWTEERVAQLVTLVAGGYTTGHIAKGWGVPRGVVIGKANRMGLRRPEGVEAIGLNPGPPDRTLSRRAAAERRAERMASRASAPLVPLGTFTLIDLEPRQCRWPLAGEGLGTLFCGDEREEYSSYCLEHYRMSRNFYRRS